MEYGNTLGPRGRNEKVFHPIAWPGNKAGNTANGRRFPFHFADCTGDNNHHYLHLEVMEVETSLNIGTLTAGHMNYIQ